MAMATARAREGTPMAVSAQRGGGGGGVCGGVRVRNVVLANLEELEVERGKKGKKSRARLYQM